MMISFSQRHDLRLLDQLIPSGKFWQSSRLLVWAIGVLWNNDEKR